MRNSVFGDYDNEKDAMLQAEHLASGRGGSVFSVVPKYRRVVGADTELVASYHVVLGRAEDAVYNTRKGWL